MSFEDASKQFYSLLKDAVRMHSRSDVKNGAALSGGLDSSSIIALLSDLKSSQDTPLEAVSYASVIPKYDESVFVHSLLKKHPVKVHFTGNDFEHTFKKIDEVILAHDEPLLSASLIAQYEVFKTAHEQGLKVMLDGQGADELLAGYGTYYLPFLKEIGPGQPFKLISEVIGLLSKHQIKLQKKLSFLRVPMIYPDISICPIQLLAPIIPISGPIRRI